MNLPFSHLVDGLQKRHFRKICVMSGAGMSVSAGIPDFRSPKTGIYANLEHYKLPYPEAIFEIKFFRKNPQPYYKFCQFVAEMKGREVATPAHYFVKLLNEKQMLHSWFTQNADMLEKQCGIDTEKVIWAHGQTDKAHCSVCDADDCPVETRAALNKGEVRYCDPCGMAGKISPVKPRVVFFGEPMPKVFNEATKSDYLKDVDLVLIIGTTLKVKPFGNIPHKIDGNKENPVPKVLINRDKVDVQGGVQFSDEGNEGKLFLGGEIDSVCKRIVQACDWEDEYLKLLPTILIEKYHKI